MLRIRVKFEKKGTIRFASHRDLMRVFRRSFASAGIPVSFSRGFNPHPRFSFGPSLRTGWESEEEYFDAILESPLDEIHTRCAPHLPDGLRMLESARVDVSAPKLAGDICAARYQVLVAPAWFERLLGEFSQEAGEKWARSTLSRFGGASPGKDSSNPRDLSGDSQGRTPRMLEVQCSRENGETLSQVTIEYFSTMHGGRSLFPEDILEPGPPSLTLPMRVIRKGLYVERDGKYVSPLSRAALETQR